MREEPRTERAVGDRVSIIVPVLQTAPILAMFLASLRETLPKGAQILLVDDGCNADARTLLDEAGATLGSEFDFTLIRHAAPRGDGAACNEALDHAVGEIVVRLESDAILRPDWVAPLCAPFVDDHVAAVAGVLLYPQSGGINHAGLTFFEMVGRHTFLNATPAVLPDSPFPVQCTTFGFTAFRRDAVRSIGGFDDRYHQGYDDLDLALRLAQQGGRLLVAPAARAFHWENSSGLHRAAGRKRNLAVFWSRWGDLITDDLWQYLERPLRDALRAATDGRALIGVDLHSDRVGARRFWGEAEARCGLALSDCLDLAHRAAGDLPIALPLALGADGASEPCRYVFLVDNFARLRGNHYFLERRAERGIDDLIIDFHGNVQWAQGLLASAWPGEKIR